MMDEVRMRHEGPPGIHSSVDLSLITPQLLSPLCSPCKPLGQAPDSGLSIRAQHPLASEIRFRMAMSPKMGQRQLSIDPPLELFLCPLGPPVHKISLALPMAACYDSGRACLRSKKTQRKEESKK